MLAVHLVKHHQMERGFATRLLQHGPVFADKGAAGAVRSDWGLAPCCFQCLAGFHPSGFGFGQRSGVEFALFGEV
jgi:hypothetical protein